MHGSPRRPSFSGSGSSSPTNDAADFECNICFELPQDPIVTLCGHLFCWPCLYKWLHHHSHSQECPVCKALIQEEKLVPIYGRGKESTGPRSRSIPGIDTPNRPSGQRPQTAVPSLQTNYFSNIGLGLMGGFVPLATARFGNVALSAAFGGLFPSLFNIQVHGFPDANLHGVNPGFPYGYFNGNGGHGHPHGGMSQATCQDQQRDSYLRSLLYVVSAFVVLTLIWS